jgi:hypothetical protein
MYFLSIISIIRVAFLDAPFATLKRIEVWQGGVWLPIWDVREDPTQPFAARIMDVLVYVVDTVVRCFSSHIRLRTRLYIVRRHSLLRAIDSFTNRFLTLKKSMRLKCLEGSLRR